MRDKNQIEVYFACRPIANSDVASTLMSCLISTALCNISRGMMCSPKFILQITVQHANNFFTIVNQTKQSCKNIDHFNNLV